MNLTVASSPHIRGNFRTNRIMLDVVIALMPALAVGVWMLGIRALLVSLISITAAVAAEWFYSVVTRTRNTTIDGSAVVTGLLLAMTLPHTVPYWQVAFGSIFAIRNPLAPHDHARSAGRKPTGYVPWSLPRLHR